MKVIEVVCSVSNNLVLNLNYLIFCHGYKDNIKYTVHVQQSMELVDKIGASYPFCLSFRFVTGSELSQPNSTSTQVGID